jgi:hypothetical protein
MLPFIGIAVTDRRDFPHFDVNPNSGEPESKRITLASPRTASSSIRSAPLTLCCQSPRRPLAWGRSSARVAVAPPYRYSRRIEFERRAMRGRIVLLLAAALFTAGAGWAELQAAGSGNSRNDRLLAAPEAQRAQALGNSFHRGCVGLEAFPMGVTASGRAKGFAYWSVRCKNGKSYVVQIPPNVKSPMIVADCSVLSGTGKECFKKF